MPLYFFYSPSCGHCMDILLEDIPKLQEKYYFLLKKYDIDILENYKLLEQMEEKTKTYGEELPIIFVGDSVFYGPEPVHSRLERTLKIYMKRVRPIREDAFKVPIDTIVPKTKEINLYYFYQPGCRECTRAEILMSGLTKRYNNIKIYQYNLFEDTNKIFYEVLAEFEKIPENRRLIAPTIIIGADYLIKTIKSDTLESLIKKYHTGSPRLDTLRIELGEKNILKRFSKFSMLGIMAAGFLDGINPCAFATIVFFVTYLLFLGRRRRDIILMSIFFIVAVFISYFSIGIGVYKLLKFLSSFDIAAKIIFLAFGVGSIIFGMLSLYDYYLAQKGRTARMILQLPLGIKQKIHKDIKEKTSVGGIIIGSIVAGFLISFLEFGCTGQVYLPTIIFMISKIGLKLKPFFALLIYNLMFVIPLIVIALFAILLTKKNIGKALEAKIPSVKFFTAILFFALGAVLLLSL